MPRRLLLVPRLVIAALLVIATAGSAAADEVGDLITLVRSQPASMDPGTWREQRRDAIKRLGRLGDKRAVPVLIEVAENELFDVAGEHAIEALGALGDQRAVAPLQKIHADDTRDRSARQLAAKALRQLGATPGAGGGGSGGGGGGPGPGGGGDDDDDDGDDGDDGGGLGGGSLGGGGSFLGETKVEAPAGPTFPDDTLGASEVFTLAAGAAHLSYDSIRDQATLDGNAAARWQRIVERQKMGYRLAADAAVAGGANRFQGGGDPEPSTTRLFVLSTTGLAEARFYFGPGVYGLTEAAVALEIANAKTNPPGGGNTESRTYAGTDLHVAVGGGYGRILDLGEALRLRRIEKVLQRQRLLGRPISGDLAEKVMRAWWALRGELGLHRRLLVTISLLREAGVMLGEPDASTTYQLLEVLRDGSLVHRPDGLDFHLAIAESYAMRDDDLFVDEGRAETVLVRARYGKQLASTVQELVGEGSARLRILAPDGETSPWSARAAAAWRRYVYGDQFDPIGAFEITAEVGASDFAADGSPFDGIAHRIGGGIGWIWIPNRASRFRLAATAAMESGEMFVGATFEATYGLLDTVFVGGSAYDAIGAAPRPTK